MKQQIALVQFKEGDIAIDQNGDKCKVLDADDIKDDGAQVQVDYLTRKCVTWLLPTHLTKCSTPDIENAPDEDQEQDSKDHENNGLQESDSIVNQSFSFDNICTNNNIDKKQEGEPVKFNCSFNYHMINKVDSSFSGNRTTFKRQKEVTLVDLKKHVEKGYAFSPYTFKQDSRSGKNAEAARLLVLDIDDKWNPETFMNQGIEGENINLASEVAYIYPSPSDSPELRKFRAVFVLQEEIDAEDMGDLTLDLAYILETDSGGAGIARFFYGCNKAGAIEFHPDRVVSDEFMGWIRKVIADRKLAKEQAQQRQLEVLEENKRRREEAVKKAAIYKEIFGEDEGWTWESWYSQVLMPAFESLSLVQQVELNTDFDHRFKWNHKGYWEGRSPFSKHNTSGTTLKLTPDDGWHCFHLQEGGKPGAIGYLTRVWFKGAKSVTGDLWGDFARKLASALGIEVPEELNHPPDKYRYFKESLLVESEYLQQDPKLAGEHLSLLVNWTDQQYSGMKFNKDRLQELAEKALNWFFREQPEALETALSTFNEGLAQTEEIQASEPQNVAVIANLQKRLSGKERVEFDIEAVKEEIKTLALAGLPRHFVKDHIDKVTVKHTWERRNLIEYYAECLKSQEEEEKELERIQNSDRFKWVSNWSKATDPYKLLPQELAEALEIESEITGLDTEFLLQPLLTLASACIGKKMGLKVGKRTVFPRRWVAMVGRPGSGKTEGYKTVLKPLAKINDEITKVTQELESYHKLIKNTWKYLTPEEKRQNANTDQDPSQFDDLLDYLRKLELYVDRFTMEGLACVGVTRNSSLEPPDLSKLPDSMYSKVNHLITIIRNAGIILLPDEITALFKGLGQYKGGQGDDYDTLIKLRTGHEISSTYAATQSRKAKDMYVNIVGGTQPDRLNQVFNVQDGTGMMRRWCFRAGMRMPQKSKPESMFADKKQLEEVLEFIFNYLLKTEFSSENCFVVLSPEAEALRDQYATEIKKLTPKESDSCGNTAIGRIEEFFTTFEQIMLETATILHGIECAMKAYDGQKAAFIGMHEISDETLKKAHYLAAVDAKNFIDLILNQSEDNEMLKEEDVKKVAATVLGHLYPGHQDARKIEASKRKDVVNGKTLYEGGCRINGQRDVEFYIPLLKAACNRYPDLLQINNKGQVTKK